MTIGRQEEGRRRPQVDVWAYGPHVVLAVAVRCRCHTDRYVVLVSCVCGHQSRMSLHEGDLSLVQPAAMWHAGTGEEITI